MQGKKQIERSIDINAPAEAVWQVLADSRLLPEWVPAVDAVTDSATEGKALGAVRQCEVTLAGKSGRMLERCVEFTPTSRVAYVVDDESFGMRKMFDDYGFAITLEARGADATHARLETHYTPRNALYTLLNELLLRRRFEKICNGIVAGLKSFTESR
jgi:uncharacterized protein YndB with AHSA1/START domain